MAKSRGRDFALSVGLCAALVGAARADMAHYPGAYSNWPTSWIALPGMNDPDDGVAEQLDFVGDSNDPGAYFEWDADYIYFRMRVDVGTVDAGTFSDSIFIVVDLPGVGVANEPDYGFGWDSNAIDPARHGMELMVPNTITTSWDTSRLADIDDQVGQKIAPPDFNLSGDGYLRSVDGVNTVSFGTTSFLDWAINFDFLEANSTLGPQQTWIIQFASIENATDHNPLGTDIAGGHSPSSDPHESWGDEVTTPEPGTAALLGLGLATICAWRRRSR